MFFVYGSRFMGKVDEVPGLFHVATKFAHVNYIPLIPLESYVIVARTSKGIRGVQIALSGKSVLFAYLRGISFCVALAAAFWAIIDYMGRGSDWPVIGAVALAAGTLFYFITYYKPFVRASFLRAQQLGAALGLSDQGQSTIQSLYGQSTGRGFDVLPPSSVATPSAIEVQEVISSG
jgi:hypothetical protein